VPGSFYSTYDKHLRNIRANLYGFPYLAAKYGVSAIAPAQTQEENAVGVTKKGIRVTFFVTRFVTAVRIITRFRAPKLSKSP
jgi:hypothetical protein